MMENRWHSTRARLRHDASAPETTGLWDRIAVSRRAGTSVDLPAREPRQPVSPVLLGVLLIVAAVAGGTALSRRTATVVVDTVAAQAADSTDSSVFALFATPAYAQVGVSPLPPIDPPDISRLTSRMLVYRNGRGEDGKVTESLGTDTIGITRDTLEGLERVAIIHTGRGGSVKTVQAIDSLVLAGDGRFLFWRFQVARFGTDRVTRVATALRTDSVTITFWRSGGRPVPEPQTSPANVGQYVREPLVAMLPSLPLREGYARSLSALDLVRGTTTPGFARSLELRVIGTQSITVPAGRFHCWTVEFSAAYLPGARPEVGQLWVDTASGSLVRAVWGQTNGSFEEQVLTKMQMAGLPVRRN